MGRDRRARRRGRTVIVAQTGERGRNPRAGPWMVAELFGEGQRELGDELARRVAGKALSFAPVMRAIEVRLA